MPKRTFFNLPEEKRRRILDCAVDEFAEHGYDMASISRMVAAAGIAKGSFYQYFEDKEDLYGYVIDSEIVQYKLLLIDEGMADYSGISVFGLLCSLCKMLLREFGRFPQYLKISRDFTVHRHEPVRKRLYEKYRGIEDHFYKNIIHTEMERKGIDPCVDLDVLAAMANGVGLMMTAHIETYGYDTITEEYLDDLFGKAEYILANGIYGNVGEYAYGKHSCDT